MNILELIDAEIARLQQARAIISGGTKRRGRPPAWMKTLKGDASGAPKRRGRPPGSKNKEQ